VNGASHDEVNLSFMISTVVDPGDVLIGGDLKTEITVQFPKDTGRC
jgi:hypothetical protein